MRFHRPERVGKLIMEYLNELLLRQIEVPDALVTITDVEVTKDLNRALVRVSVLPSEKSAEVLKILEKERGRLQFSLSRKLNIKPMPQIVFEIDYGPERAAGVERALLKKDE